DFLENANVVVLQQKLTVNDETAKRLLNTLVDKYRSMGATVDSPEDHVRRLGNNDVIVLNYGAKLPIAAFKLKQRQGFFPGRRRTYIVTCTANADTFGRYSQTFDTMLASFKVATAAAPRLSGQDFDWMPVLLGAIVGGGVGGLLVLFKVLAAKR